MSKADSFKRHRYAPREVLRASWHITWKRLGLSITDIPVECQPTPENLILLMLRNHRACHRGTNASTKNLPTVTPSLLTGVSSMICRGGHL